MPNLINLPSHDEDGQLQVVVEAPRGSRAKFKYDVTDQIFKFARPLCLGIAYPYDWGFVPGTREEDGDPLDAMVYHDMSTYPGVIIPSKAIGVVRLTQKEKGEKWERNDRLIVVPSDEKRWDDATALEKRVHQELEQFFVIVVMMTGKKVRIEGWEGPKAAKALIQKAVKNYDRGKK
ncbi:MAG: inorganic diphosphatase [Deltaproteobacteria bacterium]|nr:MAG: inorganic diphosphatase [Deltaproteobacteria bacterium]